MKYGTVCSGIEAPSVAWGALGWTPQWFSEIEPFPCAVLDAHYPSVPNLGDMTAINPASLPPIDLLCGGTPCQAFSVAGLRRSLSDDRGNLSLLFTRFAHEIRNTDGTLGPRWVLWENVPGVLSTRDNAFGCFLAGLVGADSPLVTPCKPNGLRQSWPHAGMVIGPKRSACWRVLDAQYFGLAQRRRRVFVLSGRVADGTNPAAILLECGRMRRYTPPRREARQGATGTPEGCPDTAKSVRTASGGIDREDMHTLISATVSAKWSKGSGWPAGDEAGNLVVSPLTRSPYDDNYGREYLLVAATLTKSYAENYGRTAGNNCGIAENHLITHVAFSGRERGDDGRGYGRPPQVFDDGIVGAIDTTKPHMVAQTFETRFARNGRGAPSDIAAPLKAESGGTGRGDGAPCVLEKSSVRRLTPIECERLQGFPDNYTQIPWRGKSASDCPDGPRYRALGNSMAVNVMRWIGEGIAKYEAVIKEKRE